MNTNNLNEIAYKYEQRLINSVFCVLPRVCQYCMLFGFIWANVGVIFIHLRPVSQLIAFDNDVITFKADKLVPNKDFSFFFFNAETVLN